MIDRSDIWIGRAISIARLGFLIVIPAVIDSLVFDTSKMTIGAREWTGITEPPASRHAGRVRHGIPAVIDSLVFDTSKMTIGAREWTGITEPPASRHAGRVRHAKESLQRLIRLNKKQLDRYTLPRRNPIR